MQQKTKAKLVETIRLRKYASEEDARLGRAYETVERRFVNGRPEEPQKETEECH